MHTYIREGEGGTEWSQGAWGYTQMALGYTQMVLRYTQMVLGYTQGATSVTPKWYCLTKANYSPDLIVGGRSSQVTLRKRGAKAPSNDKMSNT